MNEQTTTLKPNDSALAIQILVVALVLVAIGGIYFWKNKSLLGFTDKGIQMDSDFEPPVERSEYLQAKSKFDASDPEQAEQLKKLLMKRAIKTIPIVLSLQNEGNSIERLYKRGMLTDDMHFKVKDLKGYVDQEFPDVQREAEELIEGWGQVIWQQAMQFHTAIRNQASSSASPTTPHDHAHSQKEGSHSSSSPDETAHPDHDDHPEEKTNNIDNTSLSSVSASGDNDDGKTGGGKKKNKKNNKGKK